MNADEVRAHIIYKRDVDSPRLWEEWADRMLAALDAGAEPDYQALLKAAKWPGLPNPGFHTTQRSLRSTVFLNGLRQWMPQEGNWGHLICEVDQPTGVYIGSEPDRFGIWSHWTEFDIWQVDTTDLPHQPDLLNPGCYVLLGDVPETRLTLWEEP